MCRNVEGNAMSLTMLLRRSPDLDVEALGQMNLVSSSTVKGPEEPQPDEKEPAEHVVSNDKKGPMEVPNSLQLHSKPVPRPRHAVTPHAIHLRDLAPVPWHDGMHLADMASSNAQEEQGRAQQPPLWQSALHAAHDSPVAAVVAADVTGGQQAAAAVSPAKKKAYVHMCRWYPHINARDAQMAFDLNHSSAKLTMDSSLQPILLRKPAAQAVTDPTVRHADASADEQRQPGSAAGMSPLPDAVSNVDAQANISADTAFESADDSAAQSPMQSGSEARREAAGTVAVAEDGTAANAEPQGLYSMQEPTLDADASLAHQIGSVHFCVSPDSLTNSEVTNSAALSPEPTPASMPSKMPGTHDTSHGTGRNAVRTVSSTPASSLKSSLKSVHSAASTASSRHGSVQLGVDFAATADLNADDEDAQAQQGKPAVVRGVSDAFPAWLTEG